MHKLGSYKNIHRIQIKILAKCFGSPPNALHSFIVVEVIAAAAVVIVVAVVVFVLVISTSCYDAIVFNDVCS